MRLVWHSWQYRSNWWEVHHHNRSLRRLCRCWDDMDIGKGGAAYTSCALAAQFCPQWSGFWSRQRRYASLLPPSSAVDGKEREFASPTPADPAPKNNIRWFAKGSLDAAEAIRAGLMRLESIMAPVPWIYERYDKMNEPFSQSDCLHHHWMQR